MTNLFIFFQAMNDSVLSLLNSTLDKSLSSPKDNDPKIKLLKSAKTSLDKWKTSVALGKKHLDAIVSEKKKLLRKNASLGPEGFSFVLQSEASELRDITADLRERVDNLNRARQKFEGFIELDAISSPASDTKGSESSLPSTIDGKVLLDCLRTVCTAYEAQLELDLAVVENVAFAASEEELVFYTAAWIHQPSIDTTCVSAESAIDFALEDF